MHTIENIGEQARCHSREYWAIMCSIFQKIFKNAKNDYIAFIGLVSNFFVQS